MKTTLPSDIFMVVIISITIVSIIMFAARLIKRYSR